MVSAVSLNFDATSLGGPLIECPNLSSTAPNATIQDIMNVAAGSIHYCQSQMQSVLYVAKYSPSLGNFLQQVVQGGDTYFPADLDSLKDHYWELFRNAVPEHLGMSTAPVADGDTILWKFISFETPKTEL